MGGYHCCEPPSWPWLQRRVEKRSSVIATAHEDSHMSPRGRPYKKARWSSKQKWAAEDGEDIGQIISWASKKPDRDVSDASARRSSELRMLHRCRDKEAKP
jgi:hypothetical protein